MQALEEIERGEPGVFGEVESPTRTADGAAVIRVVAQAVRKIGALDVRSPGGRTCFQGEMGKREQLGAAQIQQPRNEGPEAKRSRYRHSNTLMSISRRGPVWAVNFSMIPDGWHSGFPKVRKARHPIARLVR